MSTAPGRPRPAWWRYFAEGIDTWAVRRPRYLLGRQWLETRHLFRGVERIPATLITTGVLWMVPLTTINAFASPYQVECGLSRAELGLFTAWGQGLSLLGFLTSGYLSDTWGRKRTLIFFDLLSWGLSMFCLAVGLNKWWCLAAILAMATNAGSNIPFNCLLVEGVKPFKRARIFSLWTLANLSPTLLLLPLAGGWLVTRFGLKPMGHLLYGACCLLFLVATLLRARMVPDSPLPDSNPVRSPQILRAVWVTSRDTLTAFLKKPAARPFFFARFIEEWKILAWGTYSALFLIDVVGITKGGLALLAQTGAYVTFAVLTIVLPYVPVKRFMRFLGYEQWFALGAMTLLLLARGNPLRTPLCLAASALGAVAGALYSSANSAYWLSIMGERERPKILSATSSLIKVGLFLAGPLAALLYVNVSPESLVAVLMALQVMQFLLLRRVVREAPHAATAGA